MSTSIHCPKCNSTQITAQKHGFSAGKAVAGAVTLGGLGLLAGLHGSSDIDITCLACGHQWNPKQLMEEKLKLASVKEYKDLKAWKNDFYSTYEAGNIDHAEMIFLSRMQYSQRFPDVHAAYRFQKKGDSQMIIVSIVAALVILAVILGLMAIFT